MYLAPIQYPKSVPLIASLFPNYSQLLAKQLENTTLDTRSVTVIKDYADLARHLRQMVSLSKNEIYLAPRYYEPAVGSTVLTKFAEGVGIHILDSDVCGVSFEKRLRTASIHDTKNRELILRFLEAPNLLTEVERLDYSFIVVDGKLCGIELINPASPDDFSSAIRVESEELAQELVKIFNGIAESRGKATEPTPFPLLTTSEVA